MLDIYQYIVIIKSSYLQLSMYIDCTVISKNKKKIMRFIAKQNYAYYVSYVFPKFRE